MEMVIKIPTRNILYVFFPPNVLPSTMTTAILYPSVYSCYNSFEPTPIYVVTHSASQNNLQNNRKSNCIRFTANVSVQPTNKQAVPHAFDRMWV